MNPPTSKNNDRLDNVHRRAVTEFKEDVFVFRWDVRSFKERLNDKDPKKATLDSPLFTFEEENRNERQWFWRRWWSAIKNLPRAQATNKLDLLPKLDWQLLLKWSCTVKRDNSTEEDTFLSVYLILKNYTTPIRTTFQFDLLDAEGKSGRKRSGNHEFDSTLGNGWEKYMNTGDLLDPKNKLLEDDTLKLRCRIIIKRHVQSQISPLKAATVGHALTQKSPMNSDISSMFTSSICTDVLIKTKGSTFKAHKAVLSCRSPVFLAMFQNQMAESIQNVVKITDFEDDIVKWMLEYIYGVEISQKDLTENALELFQIADKYDMKGLKDLVEEVLALNLSVETVVDTLILADMISVLNLKSRAINYFNMNKEAVMKGDEFQKLLNYNPNSYIFKELFTNK